MVVLVKLNWKESVMERKLWQKLVGRGGYGGLGRVSRGLMVLVLVVSCFSVEPCGADDIVHDDSLAPSQPGCANSFVLVSFCLVLAPLALLAPWL